MRTFPSPKLTGLLIGAIGAVPTPKSMTMTEQERLNKLKVEADQFAVAEKAKQDAANEVWRADYTAWKDIHQTINSLLGRAKAKLEASGFKDVVVKKGDAATTGKIGSISALHVPSNTKATVEVHGVLEVRSEPTWRTVQIHRTGQQPRGSFGAQDLKDEAVTALFP